MSVRLMPHLTVNQAMVLMDIYRGTFVSIRHLGTMQHDIRMLIDKEYINRVDPTSMNESQAYTTTILGEERVKMMLN